MTDARVHVVWLAPDADRPGRGYWDQALIEGVFDRSVWRPARPVEFVHLDSFDELPEGEGAVVVAPAAYASVRSVTRATTPLPWCLLLLTSDEEARFPYKELGRHRARQIWVQYPTVGHRADGYLPVGYAPGTPEQAAAADGCERDLDWVFYGQVSHPRREAAVDALRAIPGGELLATAGFAQGVDHAGYMEALSSAKAAPCPGGPFSADSFRLWEALEAGAVPLVDTDSAQRRGAWRPLLGRSEPPPWLWIDDWATQTAPAVAEVLADWPLMSAQCSAWWQRYKRDLAYRLDEAVGMLRGGQPEPAGIEDLITVVVPTSPIPSHPELDIITTTLQSLVEVGLGSCEVIITCDGVRPEQEHRRVAYEEAVTALVRHCEHRWAQTLPVVHREHQHQARMMRAALDLVRTPMVLYVEHDAPMEGTIDWQACTAWIEDGADVIRFAHESEVLPEHEHLMIGAPVKVKGGVRFQRTYQWSQRPHLASTAYYRRIIAEHFDPAERWMIEDRMHSVLEVAANRGRSDEHEVWLYIDHEEGRGIRRSSHLDGRGSDPKWTDR